MLEKLKEKESRIWYAKKTEKITYFLLELGQGFAFVGRQEYDKKTIGLLLVKGKNETVVKYSLSEYKNPIYAVITHFITRL